MIDRDGGFHAPARFDLSVIDDGDFSCRGDRQDRGFGGIDNGDELIPAACSRLFENFDPAQWSTFFGSEKYKTLCDNLPVPE